MLASLTVRDIVLIESALLDFAPGLNVLTGETGAGKSILLDAMGLAAGGRAGARASLRPGAAQGSAIAVFDPVQSHPARALLQDGGILSDGEIILRRVVTQDGRTRAFVNDAPIGVGLLRDIGDSLLEVHGQSDDRGLFDSSTHRRLLDSFGNHTPLVEDVAAKFAALDILRQTAAALRKAAEAARLDADYTRHAAKELSDLAPEDGEETQLAAQRSMMMQVGKIAEDLSQASLALSGERGAEAGLASALKRLSRMQEDARKSAQAAESALEQAFALTEEARRELDSLFSNLNRDPRALERLEDRLHALRDAARKYHVTPDALPRLLEDFEARRDALETSDSQIKHADAAIAAARTAYLEAAAKLSAARQTSARALEKAVAAELGPLKLGHAKFRVALESNGAESAGGMEKISFQTATIDGADYGSLAKIASGGELARFSLALKVALSESGPTAALVFDEVDRGVGGAVADAVGERLQRLASSTQVLLVTHSPQVAARATRHFRISRKGDKMRVDMLGEPERLEELARMLSGATITEEARAAARRLLAEAQDMAGIKQQQKSPRKGKAKKTA